jgi:hypothetical protein
VDILIGILVAFVALVVIAVVVGRKVVTRGVDPTQLTFDPSVMTDVHALARAGRKVHAIALLRQATPDLSLVAATAMVEKMATREPGPPAGADGAGPGNRPEVPDVPLTAPPATWTDNAPSASVVPFEIELQVRNLAAQGRADEAVDLLRSDAGFDAEEARDFVRGL